MIFVFSNHQNWANSKRSVHSKRRWFRSMVHGRIPLCFSSQLPHHYHHIAVCLCTAELRAAMEATYVTSSTPGGSGQNTARVVQWLLGVPRCTTVLACIGNDSTGRQLARYVQQQAVWSTTDMPSRLASKHAPMRSMGRCPHLIVALTYRKLVTSSVLPQNEWVSRINVPISTL